MGWRDGMGARALALLVAWVVGACRDAPAPAVTLEDAGVDAGPPCAGTGVTKGPWSLAADATQVVIRWESCRPGESEVTAVPEAPSEVPVATARASSVVTPVDVSVDNTAAFNPSHPPDRAGRYFMNEARLGGLLPSTCYVARPAVDTARSVRFCTARRAGEPFRFAAVADTSPGQGPATSRLVAMLAGQHADFTLHGGDLQYYPFETWTYWFEAMTPFLAQGALFPAVGNHESEKPTERDEHVRRYFGNAQREGNDERYRFEWGGVWFFALGTEEGIGPGSEQAGWLETNLADARRRAGFRFSVVYFHKPLVTCGDKEDDPAARRHLEPIFLREKVALVIQSHMHGYERFEAGALTYLTSGGGGAGLQNVDTHLSRAYCNQRKAAGSFHHAMLFEVSKGKLTGTAVDDTGAPRDRFEMIVP